MALRQVAQLSLGSARWFSGSLSRLNSSLASSGAAAGSQGDAKNGNVERYSSLSGRQFLDKASPNFASQFLNNNTEEKQQQRQLPHVPALASAMRAMRPSPLLPARRAPLGMAGSSISPIGQQTRAFNAWSPAQRYFVEGEHVVNAELSRTFQFTGLDSGSFYPFAVYTAFATVIATVFMVLPLVVAPSRVDLDKSSAYECGFDAFGEARQTFSVSFYLVSIMYLLFDIEIAYLFPYVMSHANAQMFWTMNLFLGILVVGFIYEWGVGALEWRE